MAECVETKVANVGGRDGGGGGDAGTAMGSPSGESWLDHCLREHRCRRIRTSKSETNQFLGDKLNPDLKYERVDKMISIIQEQGRQESPPSPEPSSDEEIHISPCGYYSPTLRDEHQTLPEVWKQLVLCDPSCMLPHVSIPVNTALFEYLINPQEPMPWVFWAGEDASWDEREKKDKTQTQTPSSVSEPDDKVVLQKTVEKEKGCGGDAESDESWCSGSDRNTPSPPAMVKNLMQQFGQNQSPSSISSEEEEKPKKDYSKEYSTKVEVTINGSPLQKDYGSEFWNMIPSLDDTMISFFHEMRKAIHTLGGIVHPKYCWAAPKDARALGFNKQIVCHHPSDALQLFKFSERIAEAFTRHRQHQLAIKEFLAVHPEHASDVRYYHKESHITFTKWLDGIQPDEEFRCFVYNRKLTSICQRNCFQGYPSIIKFANTITKDIHDFFRKNIFTKYPLDCYVFDVIRKQNKVILVDFAVFGKASCLAWSYRTFIQQYTENELAVKEGDNQGMIGVEKYGRPQLNAMGLSDMVIRQDPDIQCPLPLCFKEANDNPLPLEN